MKPGEDKERPRPLPPLACERAQPLRSDELLFFRFARDACRPKNSVRTSKLNGV